MIRSRLARGAAAVASAVITLFTSTGIAAAQSPDPCAPSNEALPSYEVTNVRHSGTYDNFDHGPDWTVEGRGPAKLSLSRTVEASNSFSVSMQVPTGPLSAAVGFDVTEGVSYTASYEYEIPAEPRNHRWFIEAGTRDAVYTYDVQRYCLGFPDGPAVRGRAERSGHLIYQVFSRAPGTPRS
ncbi:hypothetical protein K1T35_41600 [Pseudonocardia sp. DSM 110487]|jgi:hypothetical protein|uniref:hypothetical protein n=1 Tax=Pseudonocardia sp. DSM 110487 TaxID=2865833 RepID=UPI001C69B762|nr:hypothetical protein [Pseudonocardia sp. DSM 110487]QYN34802.1 hypothetical protein K1T35_41600 [Pseudonocardia sp. DSM 110487]